MDTNDLMNERLRRRFPELSEDSSLDDHLRQIVREQLYSLIEQMNHGVEIRTRIMASLRRIGELEDELARREDVL